jgi:hypothetical protein
MAPLLVFKEDIESTLSIQRNPLALLSQCVFALGAILGWGVLTPRVSIIPRIIF